MPAISSELENWLAAHRQVFAEIYWEMDINKVVTIDRGVPFACNDCGRCCYTQDFGIFVYPMDIDRMLNAGAFLPLCCLFPQEDEDGHVSYAFPSKIEWFDMMETLEREDPEEHELIAMYKHVSAELTRVNPDLTQKDNSCIFYANLIPARRCLIYNVRPTCCRVYPFDRFAISRLQVPPALALQYHLIGQQDGAVDPNLYCDPECFQKRGKFKFKQIRTEILTDKANAIVNAHVAVDEEEEMDVSLELLENFWRRIGKTLPDST
ncbi:MAG TPA: YkgJ family cysteine cluster protein [Candidatus Lokiarchaeia archaeon]|nr:YkgJ family cysteine cluster protein [Candidatus Lokiarchaeia archaeon]